MAHWLKMGLTPYVEPKVVIIPIMKKHLKYTLNDFINQYQRIILSTLPSRRNQKIS